MSLIDNIHQGNIKFHIDDFVLLKFSFQGSIFRDTNCLASNVNIEGIYDITGKIKIFMATKSDIQPIENEKFINYKILGEDDDYKYEINNFYFNARDQQNPFKPSFQYIYKGSSNSNILIAKKNQNVVNAVVCDCICNQIPMYRDNIIIDWRDINISQNRNLWNNSDIIHIFKNILGTTLQYPVPNTVELDLLAEIKLYDKLEYVLSLIIGHDFGISICKYINSEYRTVELYVIRNRTTNNYADHQVLCNDIKKIKHLIENCNILNKVDTDYYKKTIASLSKLHSESDILIKWSILIITFERFLKQILLENGSSEVELKDKNLMIKLRKYNKIIKKIPKQYLSDELVTEYRNPLIHGGELYETNLDKIVLFYFAYLDLLYEIILDSMGYNDEIILSSKKFEWGKILLKARNGA